MRYIYLILIVLYSSQSYGQSVEDPSTTSTDIACLDTSFGFEFDFTLSNSSSVSIAKSTHKNGAKIYICKSRLPIIVNLKDLTTDAIPNATSYIWKGDIDGSYGQDHQAKLNFSHFKKNTKKAKFTCEIELAGGAKTNVTLVVYIFEKLGIQPYDTKLASMWSIDENDENDYPFYTNAKPWKYYPAHTKDVLIFDRKYSSPQIKNIENINFSDDPEGKFDFKMNNLELELIQKTLTQSNYISEIIACENIEIANVDVRIKKQTQTIDIIIVCESDDDFANYCHDKDPSNPPWSFGDVDGSLESDCVTPISSPSFECINPGQDLSLDLYDWRKYYKLKLNDSNRKSDIPFYTMEKLYDLKIKPSIDPTYTNPYFCNSRPYSTIPNTELTDCPSLSQTDKSEIESSFIELYGKTDVDFIFNYITISGNFDSIKDDNIISKDEQDRWHAFQTQGLVTNLVGSAPNNTKIWIVHDILESSGSNPNANTAGRATGFLANTATVDPTHATNRTYVHEVGHCKYGLHHPDSAGFKSDGLGNKVINDDEFNFMNSGNLQSTFSPKQISDYNIRKYQWELIYDINN